MIPKSGNPVVAGAPEGESYAKEIQERYDGAQTYHDGKWILFEPVDTSLFICLRYFRNHTAEE